MIYLKNFESWNNNIIDNTLFVSGRAKYNPTIIGGIIHYKTGNIEPYFYAEISKKGDKFICKVYKVKKNGDKLRIRNKIKKDLKTAHNYVREFLNQKLRTEKKKKLKNKSNDIEKIISMREPNQVNQINNTPPPFVQPDKIRKTIVRRF